MRTASRATARSARSQLLGGRSLHPARPTGCFPVRPQRDRALHRRTPATRRASLLGRRRTAAIGVIGDGEPGRGHWFFTPAPLVFASGLLPAHGSASRSAPPWGSSASSKLELRGGDRACALVLDYEGHTEVDGEFDAPADSDRAGRRRSLRRAAHVPRGCSWRAARLRRPSRASSRRGGPSRCSAAGVRSARARATPAARRPPSRRRRSYDAYLARARARRRRAGNRRHRRQVAVDVRAERARHGEVARPARLDRRPGMNGEQTSPALVEGLGPEGLPPELCVRNRDGDAGRTRPDQPERDAFARDATRRCSRRRVSTPTA